MPKTIKQYWEIKSSNYDKIVAFKVFFFFNFSCVFGLILIFIYSGGNFIIHGLKMQKLYIVTQITH